jgi:hypothetical protein
MTDKHAQQSTRRSIGPLWPGGPDAFAVPSPCMGCPLAKPDPASREGVVMCGWEPVAPALYWQADAIGLCHRSEWQSEHVAVQSCPAREAHANAAR